MSEITRIKLPAANWSMALSAAVREATSDTVIVVDSDAKRQLAYRAAERFGKTVNVEIQPTPAERIGELEDD